MISGEKVFSQCGLGRKPEAPDCLVRLFFILQTPERQIAISQENQNDMAMPSCP